MGRQQFYVDIGMMIHMAECAGSAFRCSNMSKEEEASNGNVKNNGFKLVFANYNPV